MKHTVRQCLIQWRTLSKSRTLFKELHKHFINLITEYHLTLIVDLSADVAPESLLEAPPIRGRIGVAAVLTLSFTYISHKGNMDIETQWGKKNRQVLALVQLVFENGKQNHK